MPRKRIKEPLTMNDLQVLVADEKNGKPNYGAILHYYRRYCQLVRRSVANC